MNIEESQRRFMESCEPQKLGLTEWLSAIAVVLLVGWIAFSQPIAEFLYQVTK